MTVPQAPLLVSRGGRSCFQDQPSLTPKCVGDEYPSAGPCLIPSALCPSVQAGGCKAGFTSERSGFLGYNLVLERRGRKLHCVPTVSQQVQGRVTSETGQERATRLGQRPPRTPASAVAPWPAAAGGAHPRPASPLPCSLVCTLGCCDLQTSRSGHTKLRPTHLLSIWEAGAGVTVPGGQGGQLY